MSKKFFSTATIVTVFILVLSLVTASTGRTLEAQNLIVQVENISTQTDSVDSSVPLTVSHTITNADALVVLVFTRATATPSVSYNGAAMEPVDFIDSGSGQGSGNRITAFVLMTPSTGVHDIVVSKTNSYVSLIAVSITNVNQISPIGVVAKSNPEGTNVSDTVLSASGDMALDAYFHGNPTVTTVGSGQTKILGGSFGPGNFDGSFKSEGTTMSMEGSSVSASQAHIVLPIHAGMISEVLRVRKTTDQSIQNANTLQADSSLNLTLIANKTYIVDGTIFVSAASAAPDLKIAFTAPSNSTVTLSYSNSSDDGILSGNTSSPGISIPGSNTSVPIHFSRTVMMGNSSGNFGLQWAQNSSSNAQTTVKAGSYLRAEEI